MLLRISECKKREPFYYKDWTRWFAWHPVRVSPTGVVWLESVERMDSQPLNDDIIWTYRRFQ